jgi:ribosomal protein L31
MIKTFIDYTEKYGGGTICRALHPFWTGRDATITLNGERLTA